MRKKQALTLLEMLLALGLVALLLSTLFFWYGRLSTRREVVHREKHLFYEERFCDERLASLFATATPTHFCTSVENHDIIEGTSLIVTFDRGPHPEPLLSNAVLGRLYLDRAEHALCLALWPNPEAEFRESPCERLILLPGISSIDFEFYNPPDKRKKEIDPQAIGQSVPQEGLQTTWRHDYNALPAIVKVTIERGERKLLFSYDLRNCDKRVTYLKEGG